MNHIDVPQSHHDLLDSAPVATLSTLGADGYPQVTAITFWFDGTVYRMTVSSGRQKVKNVQAHPECTLFMIDFSNPYRTLEVRGRAEVIPDADYEWAAKIAESKGSSVADVKATAIPGESRVSIVLHPARVRAQG